MLLLTVFLTACQLSSKDKAELKEYETLAESYYEEKYNIDIEIINSSYNYYVDNFKQYTKHSMFFETSDNNLIYYDKLYNEFSDTKQTKQIYDRISTSLLPELVQYIKNPYYWDYEGNTFSCNITFIAGEYSTSVFHTYYDEEKWAEFFVTEKPSISFDNKLFIISNENTKRDEITNYIHALFSQYMDVSHLKIVFLTEELYRSGTYYDIEGEEGFFEEKNILSSTSYSIKQNYVQIADGIYITSLDPDMEFTKDDFVISEQMPLTSGHAYQFDFSDSYKERTNFSKQCYPSFCIKVLRSEIDENLDAFCFYAKYKNKDPYFRRFSLESECTTCYFYINYSESDEFYFGLGPDIDWDLAEYY